MKKTSILFILFIIVFSNNFVEAQNLVVLSNEKKLYKLGKYLKILKDKKGSYSIDDVVKKNKREFIQCKKEIPNFGLTPCVYWTYFKILNKSNKKQYILEISWPLHDNIQIYRKTNKEEKIELIHEIGDIFEFNSRDVKHRNFIYYFDTEYNELTEYYIRFKSNDSIIIPLKIWDVKEFVFQDRVFSIILGVFFGVLFVMVFYNLSIFFSMNEKNYLIYVFILISYIFIEFAYTGIGYTFIWSKFSWIQQHALSFFMCTCVISFIYFTKKYLNMSIFSVKFNQIMNIYIIITFIVLFISLFLNVMIGFYIINIWTIAGGFVAVTATVLSLKKGFSPGKYYLIAWIPFIVFVPILILKNMSILPSNFFTEYSTKLGMAAQVVLLSLAIGNKINIMREERILAQQEAIKSLKKVEKQMENFILTLADAIESKDAYTGGHVERVAKYSRDIAKELDFTKEEINQIYLGAIVHDVGKIGVRDFILNKKEQLTTAEFDEIKNHPLIGHRLLNKISDIQIAAKIALYHQEKWDGTGYPYGLEKNKIPFEARIVTIADFWDAIISNRPYRKGLNLKEALKLMFKERGGTLDPYIFDIFIEKNLYLKYIPDDRVKEIKELEKIERKELEEC